MDKQPLVNKKTMYLKPEDGGLNMIRALYTIKTCGLFTK